MFRIADTNRDYDTCDYDSSNYDSSNYTWLGADNIPLPVLSRPSLLSILYKCLQKPPSVAAQSICAAVR